jgi:hypothetical protein
MHVRIELAHLPLTLELQIGSVDRSASIVSHRDYVGRRVELALEAEQLLDVLADHCTFGFFDDEGELDWALEMGARPEVRSWKPVLQALVDIADFARWVLHVPPLLEGEDSETAERLLALARGQDWEVLRGPFSIRKSITDIEAANLRAGPLDRRVQLTMVHSTPVTFLGVERPFPPREVVVVGASLSPETQQALRDGTANVAVWDVGDDGVMWEHIARGTG